MYNYLPTNYDIKILFPFITILVFLFPIFIFANISKKGFFPGAAIISLTASCLAAYFTVKLWDTSATAMNGLIIADNFSRVFHAVFLLGLILSILMSFGIEERKKSAKAVFFATSALFGMMLTAAAGDLIVVLAGIEIFGFSSSRLTYSRTLVNEKMLRFRAINVIPPLLFTAGAALLRYVTGTTDIYGIKEYILFKDDPTLLFLVGCSLLAAGFSMRCIVTGAGFWLTADYKNIPDWKIAYVTVGATASFLAVLYRVMYVSFWHYYMSWATMLVVASSACITIGNLTALFQKEIRRMVGCLCIAHAGYAIISVASEGEFGNISILYYLLIFTINIIGFFGVISLVRMKDGSGVTMEKLSCLEIGHPVVSAVLSVFLLSLSGFPLTAGFFALFRILISSVKSEMTALTVVGSLSSLITAFLYARVIAAIYLGKPGEGVEIGKPHSFQAAAIAVSLAGTVLLGLAAYRIVDILSEGTIFVY